eukprot:m.284253 g.284253  ORF g.284253 m.284253 type:complete len:300 (-) comp15761_c2_seq14:403-1302(-)
MRGSKRMGYIEGCVLVHPLTAHFPVCRGGCRAFVGKEKARKKNYFFLLLLSRVFGQGTFYQTNFRCSKPTQKHQPKQKPKKRELSKFTPSFQANENFQRSVSQFFKKCNTVSAWVFTRVGQACLYRGNQNQITSPVCRTHTNSVLCAQGRAAGAWASTQGGEPDKRRRLCMSLGLALHRCVWSVKRVRHCAPWVEERRKAGHCADEGLANVCGKRHVLSVSGCVHVLETTAVVGFMGVRAFLAHRLHLCGFGCRDDMCTYAHVLRCAWCAPQTGNNAFPSGMSCLPTNKQTNYVCMAEV